MKVYFASDFHLKFHEDQEDTARRKKVISFLDSLIGNCDLLILNGDVFDLWFTWKKVIIKGYFPILKKLADLNENGCRIVFIAGNHDFWFKDFLTDYLNIEIYRNNFSEIIDNVKIFVSHGDLYTSNDLRYKVFRSFIRNKFIKTIFELFHPDFSLAIGKTLSRSSRSRTIPFKLQKAKEKGLDEIARKKLKDFDLVVLGHSHSPKFVKTEDGIYVNLGDWISNYTYLKMINGKIELCKYEK